MYGVLIESFEISWIDNIEEIIRLSLDLFCCWYEVDSVYYGK